MPEPSAFVDEVANELDSWPGVLIEPRPDGVTVVRYRHSELGLLYPDRGIAELPFLGVEHDELIEHGEAEPAEATPDSVASVMASAAPRTSTRCWRCSIAATARYAGTTRPTAPRTRPERACAAVDERRLGELCAG